MSLVAEDSHLAIIMVGLPARGKTTISRKVARYLEWLGIKTQVFNVGNYRRAHVGANQSAQFFDPNNLEGVKQREEAAFAALNDMLEYFLLQKGTVGIYDATNSTIERRIFINEKLTEAGISCIFVESICHDENLILQNVKEVKISSPDYLGMDPEKAAEDFIKRIKNYEKCYQTLQPNEMSNTISYVKLINVGLEINLLRIKGYLQSRIVYYLMNLHITPRCFFLTRHGESIFNVLGKIGGDSDLSPRGQQYSHQLSEIIKNQLKPNNKKLTIWLSTLKRTHQTAQYLKDYPQIQFKSLDELNTGICDSLTYKEIEEKFPDDFHSRDENKFEFRYKFGESYKDVVQRLEPVIIELERHNDPNHLILIIAHQAVIRCLYAYFLGFDRDQLPWLKIPLHTLIKLTPKTYGCDEERIQANISAVDTHREKPIGSNTSSPKQSPNSK